MEIHDLQKLHRLWCGNQWSACNLTKGHFGEPPFGSLCQEAAHQWVRIHHAFFASSILFFELQDFSWEPSTGENYLIIRRLPQSGNADSKSSIGGESIGEMVVHQTYRQIRLKHLRQKKSNIPKAQ